MNATLTARLSYPIGQFVKPSTITNENLLEWIAHIARFPADIELLTSELDAKQLNWVYRPNGWSIKQVVHHCVDSHINSLCRFKLALTEDNPTIRPYHEDRWATLADSLTDDIADALTLLRGLHSKWTYLLKSLNEDDLNRTFIHPESGDQVTLKENIGIYAWHCNHHLAHIQQALVAKGKYNQ